MKRFFTNLGIYVIVFLLMSLSIELYRNRNGVANRRGFLGAEIYQAISKSLMNCKVGKLVLGDSVGLQLYPSENDYDDMVSLACNQAITVAGQYFLLLNVIESNKNDLPKEVILIITPFSLSNDVDHFAYHYFLKPFPPKHFSKYYTEHLAQRIHSIPLYWTANLPFIRTSNYTPQWAVPSPQTTNSLSLLSYEYLLRMDSVAKANDMTFRMVCPPIRDDRRNEVDQFFGNLPDGYMTKLSGLLRSYQESVVYMPSECYWDQTHLNGDQIPVDYLRLLSH